MTNGFQLLCAITPICERSISRNNLFCLWRPLRPARGPLTTSVSGNHFVKECFCREGRSEHDRWRAWTPLGLFGSSDSGRLSTHSGLFKLNQFNRDVCIYITMFGSHCIDVSVLSGFSRVWGAPKMSHE